MENNVIINKSDVFVLNNKDIIHLKTLAINHSFKRSRICLHSSNNNNVQEMIIVAHKSSNIQIHKHPINKPESYHVLEGKLLVKIFDDMGNIKLQEHLYSNKYPRMYRIEGNIWHQPIPITEWVVYHEVATGPFDKDKDVEYFKSYK